MYISHIFIGRPLVVVFLGLDVPSSGLILAAKTYRAYFNLRLQLETGSLTGNGP